MTRFTAHAAQRETRLCSVLDATVAQVIGSMPQGIAHASTNSYRFAVRRPSYHRAQLLNTQPLILLSPLSRLASSLSAVRDSLAPRVRRPLSSRRRARHRWPSALSSSAA
eukprot:1563731-Rhodomonas_salina.1